MARFFASTLLILVAAFTTVFADPIDKSELRTSPKTTQASPGVYFDPDTGTFRKRVHQSSSAATLASNQRRKQALRERIESRSLSSPSSSSLESLTSSEEKGLSAILPLVRFRKGKDAEDLTRVVRRKKTTSSTTSPTAPAVTKSGSSSSRLVKVRTRPSRTKPSSKKRRVVPKGNDFDDDDDDSDDEEAFDGKRIVDEDYFGDYGSESRTSLRNAPGQQFGASTRRSRTKNRSSRRAQASASW